MSFAFNLCRLFRVRRYMHLLSALLFCTSLVACILYLEALTVAVNLPVNEVMIPQCASGNFTGRPKDPSLIIIGCQKCGSTALRDHLDRSPHMSRSRANEPAFFLNCSEGKWHEGGCEDLARYRNQFHISVGQLGFEKSPSYMCDPAVPQRVRQWYPWMKLIAIFRDPVLRALSHYYFFQRIKFKPWANFRGLYADHMLEWFRFFDRSQILIIPYESYVKRPSYELERIEKFLGISLDIAEPNLDERRTSAERHVEEYDDVLVDLRRFYAPHNRRFCQLVDGEALGIPWCNYDDESVGTNE